MVYNFVIMQKLDPPIVPTISFQQDLRLEVPLILGCREYQDQLLLLKRMNLILKKSGLEKLFIKLSLEHYEAELQKEGKVVEDWMRVEHVQWSERALRCTVLRHLLGESFRGMSMRLAECQMFRGFCNIEEFEVVRVPGKSTLQVYEQCLPAEKMKMILTKLTLALSDEEKAEEMGLEETLKMEIAYMDTTCLEANIHFPTDWILMRDGVRSLMTTITTIRGHGLKKRMPEPSSLISEINSLCMAMSAAGKAEKKKERKRILRMMKKVAKKVKEHAERYSAALDEQWATATHLSRKKTKFFLRRLDLIIGQLPEAMRQAHERIIGERQIPSNKKILSLYEPDLHTLNRGKAGAQVEFGNTFFIVEGSCGYILSHELLKDYSPGDAKLFLNHFDNIKEATGGNLKALGADRGFSTRATKKFLASEKMYNGFCPKAPTELAERLKEGDFKKMLKRRAQTEGRIGILKNVFLQETPRAKGFKNRSLQVTWAVLAHNLWIVARKAVWKEAELAPLAA